MRLYRSAHMSPATRNYALLVSIFAISCAHSQVWVASGESIAALYDTYDATGRAMDAALDAKRISPDEYRRWAAFAHYFKPTLDLLADQWLTDMSAEHAAGELARLEAQLALYSMMTAKDGGEP